MRQLNGSQEHNFVFTPDEDGEDSKNVDNNIEKESEDEKKPLSLAELFAEDDEDNLEDNDDSKERGEKKDSKPVESMEALATRLNMESDDILKIKIPMKTGEPMTIGDLQERVGELVDHETRVEAFEQRRIQNEGKILKAENDLRELVSMIPREHITPQLVEKLRARQTAVEREERRLTLQHIPDWADSAHGEERRKEDISGMMEFLGQYGFPESFITTVIDHRALKFIRDAYMMNKRVQKALAKVKKVDPKINKAAPRTGKAPTKPSNGNERKQSKVKDQRSLIMSFFGTEE